MKTILITILFFLPFAGIAQTNTTRITALEKQQTIFKADITWLKAGKKTDSLKIVNLTLANKKLEDSVKTFKRLFIIESDQVKLRKGLLVDTLIINQIIR